MSLEQYLSAVAKRADDLRERERESLADARELGCMNTPGAGQSIGALDTLNEIEPDLRLLLRIIAVLREPLERIGAVDMPSASDKTAWIVMLESVGALARTTLAEADKLCAEGGGRD